MSDSHFPHSAGAVEPDRHGHVRQPDPGKSEYRPPRVLVAPSLLSADFGRLAEEVRAVEAAGADLLHVDVMDGRFVPNITIGPLVVQAVRRVTALPLDVHLMIVEPERYIEDFVAAGAARISVHAETCVHLHRTLQQIASAGAAPAVAINPATPLGAIEEVLADVAMILLMSVNPGFGGQSFLPQTLDKLKRLRQLIAARGMAASPPLIEVDGGIKPSNAKDVVHAGADVLVAGSAVFGAPDYGQAITALRAG